MYPGFKRHDAVRRDEAPPLLSTMQGDEFLETIRQEASLDSNDAARNVAEATLRTFGERITDGEASDLARTLPAEFEEALTDVSPGEAEPFPLEEFTDRVSNRADVDESRVIEYSRAVATALAQDADVKLDAAREQLPSEFDVIFEPSGPIREDEFLETVQQRTNVDSSDVAREATTTTLRTLGERLSEGEASDLALYLPESFEETLTEATDESITAYSFDEFVDRVAEREGVENETARIHAQAVTGTIVETVSENELDAMENQLPDQFRVLFESSSSTDTENT